MTLLVVDVRTLGAEFVVALVAFVTVRKHSGRGHFDAGSRSCFTPLWDSVTVKLVTTRNAFLLHEGSVFFGSHQDTGDR